MISGRDCWNVSVQGGMGARRLGGRDLYTFENMGPSLYHQLLDTAHRTPGAVAVVDDLGRRTTFAALLGLVDRLAAHLARRLGVMRGDHVGLLMHADLEFVVVLYACSKVGAVCVTIPSKYRKPEAVSLMFAADLSLLVAGEEFGEWRASFPLEADRVLWSVDVAGGYGFRGSVRPLADVVATGRLEDPAIMMFTSGTTSAAKGVVLRNYNVIHAAMVYQRLMGTTPADRTLIPIPIYHVTGLIALLAQFVYVGATVYLHRFYDPRRILECVRDEGITYLHGSPTSFVELLRHRGEFPELPSLRAMLSGSSYEPVDKMRAFHAWCPTASFQVVYGLTETSSPALLFPWDSPTSIHAGATGKPVPGVDAKICDPQGEEVASGEDGELWLRGACVTEGYYRRASGSVTSDGWLRTGDVAHADDEGLVWVVGRRKDMINRGGEKIWCSCLEEVLATVDGVADSCVTGIPDELYGEVPVAAIVREPGSDIDGPGIQDALASRIAHYKIPVRMAFVDEIPLTTGEKPDRAAVREAVLASVPATSNRE